MVKRLKIVIEMRVYRSIIMDLPAFSIQLFGKLSRNLIEWHVNISSNLKLIEWHVNILSNLCSTQANRVLIL